MLNGWIFLLVCSLSSVLSKNGNPPVRTPREVPWWSRVTVDGGGSDYRRDVRAEKEGFWAVRGKRGYDEELAEENYAGDALNNMSEEEEDSMGEIIDPEIDDLYEADGDSSNDYDIDDILTPDLSSPLEPEKRGFSIKPTGLFSTHMGKQASKRAAFKPNGLFSSINGKRGGFKPNGLFGSYGGKRGIYKPNGLFLSMPGKRSLKPNSLFGSMKGKRGIKPNGLFVISGKRTLSPNLFAEQTLHKRGGLVKPNGMFSQLSGKRNLVLKPNGFFLTAKRFMKPNSLFSSFKREPMSRLMKTTKFHSILEDLENNNDLLSNDDQEDIKFGEDELVLDDEPQIDVLEKRKDPDSFWAVRGKRDANFWAVRGKRSDPVDFWAVRGKRQIKEKEKSVSEAEAEEKDTDISPK